MRLLLSTLFLLLAAHQLTAYTRPDCVPEETWNSLKRYFLPETDPIKPSLDKLFEDPTVLKSIDDLKRAHFKTTRFRNWDKIIVAKHKKLKGYLIKLFTDSQKVAGEWKNWVKRIEGARVINEAIKKHHYEHLFKTPKKWIYPLRRNTPDPYQKCFVLIVEDLKIYKHDENLALWSSDWVNEELLDALYTILKEVGLNDSIFADNIPFSKIDGKIAFIDTENYNKWPVKYERIAKYLKPRHRNYWNQLIQTN